MTGDKAGAVKNSDANLAAGKSLRHGGLGRDIQQRDTLFLDLRKI